MSATIITRIVGTDKVVKDLSAKENRSMSAIERAVKSSALGLVAHIKKEKLSGQVLKVRTGTLRRSITAKFETGSNEFRARVGTNLSYARIHEYGLRGSVNVRAHQRQMNTAWGRRVANPRKVDVRAHAMRMNMPARPFMQPALEENREKINLNIRKALREALK